MSQIKVVTWNVHETTKPDDGRHFSVSPTVDDADIAFIQEAPVSLTDSFLSHRHVASWMLEPSVSSKGDQMGLVILSRYPIRKCVRRTFPNPGWSSTESGVTLFSHPKGALIAEIDHPERLLRVACIHLLPTRIFQIDEDSEAAHGYVADVARDIHASGIALDIIAGDFNNRSRMLFFGSQGYVSATKGRITRTSGDSHDDVMVLPSLSLLGVEIDPGPSDHHAVKVDIGLG